MTKVGLISLGCDKNRVDSERILFSLANNGYELTEDVSNADVVIVNTCAFIGDAKKESIDNILEMAELKKTSLKKLLVTGCFATRYGQDVREDLPEVDAFVDIKDEEKIIEILNNWFNYDTHIDGKCGRIITTPMHYAYLKIADGCNNRCSYCAIPFIRGKYISTPIEELVEEATTLYKEGVKELILVAQDTTNYGVDIYGKRSLVTLLKELTKIDFWKIRLLYCYPELIDEELIDFVVNNEKMAKYFDIPMQHINDEVLKKMHRRSNGGSIRNLVNLIRKKDSDITIRSTFICGFPQETDEQSKELVSFVESALDYAGFFVYSPEEGTKAYELDGRIKKGVASKRRLACEKAQVKSTINRHNRLVGRTLEVIYEGIDYNKSKFYGRSEFSAPGIDPHITFTSDIPLEVGCVYNVEITKGGFYLEGKVVTE